MQQKIKILFIYLFSIISFDALAAFNGDFYSESTYIPKYGLVSESRVLLSLYSSELISGYMGISLQFQNKNIVTQENLYEKNLATPLVGGRLSVWPNIFVFAELRTEKRSRIGIFAGNLWEYYFLNSTVFSEAYAESIVLPFYHSHPVSTAWFKQGLRFRPANGIFVDPYVELYVRRSPDLNLGRDTEQGRLGLRTTFMAGRWSVSALAYKAFPLKEAPHGEGLLVIGGSF